MFKGSLGFKAYSGVFFVLSLLTIVGCSKKVVPVTGSEGLSSGEMAAPESSAPSLSDQGGGRSEDMASSMESETSKPDHDMGAMGGSEKSDMAMAEAAAKFASTVYFDFDMWTIRNDAKDALTENARWLVENTDVKIQIEGHGDERGTNEYNLALGERRARSTMRYLTNMGVAPSRISFISYGEEKSVCNEKTEDCFQKNRRAHFIVKK